MAQVLGRLIETYGAELPPTTRLVAADLSPGMIAAVQGRQAAEIAAADSKDKTVWARVETAICDAADLADAIGPDGGDDAFSHVMAGLVLLMVQRPREVLAETLRVLRPGGVFGMTSFRSVGWMDIIGEALSVVSPGTGLGAIPEAWASTARVRASLEEAGFREVCVEEVQTFYEFTDAEAMTRFNVANIPSVKAVTATMTGDEVQRAIQWMVKRLGERFPDGRGRLEGTAIVATGRK